MHKLVAWIQVVLVPWLGAPGVFLVAFLDSSFLSFPEINDLIVVMAAISHPETVWLFVLMTTLGSLAGCSVLWWLGRRGGEAVLARRFGEERVDRLRRAFGRWDVMALAGPALLPPPMPFKAFVISAGVFGVPFRRFALTLLTSRGLRYALWAALGALYGERSIAMLKVADRWFLERGWVLALGSTAALALFVLVLVVRRRRPPASAPGGASLV